MQIAALDSFKQFLIRRLKLLVADELFFEQRGSQKAIPAQYQGPVLFHSALIATIFSKNMSGASPNLTIPASDIEWQALAIDMIGCNYSNGIMVQRIRLVFAAAVCICFLTSATAQSASQPLWCQTSDNSAEWTFNPVFGWMYTPFCPWVYIDQKGWFYSTGPEGANNALWFYSPVNDWFWTADDVFPFIWSNLTQDWLLYDDLSLTTGRIQSGGTGAVNGLANVPVQLFLATGPEHPTLLADWTTDEEGEFSFSTPISQPDGILYFTAEVDSKLRLAAVSNGDMSQQLVVNELTTVATAYAFAQLFDADSMPRASLLALRIATGMAANLADVSTGGSSSVLLSSPNADQTNSLRSTRNLANLIAAALADPQDVLPQLLSLATPANGIEPADTLQALVNIARNPANNVDGVYLLSQQLERYQPSLALPPDAWTLAVKVNDTGSADAPFGGPANTVFDERGYVWINNNVIQGEGISTTNIIVLKPDGSPSDGTHGTPLSPVSGGGILGAGFGITLNKADNTIWVGNYGWGGLNPGPVEDGGTGTGSVSQIALDGTPLSPDTGYDGGTNRVQGILSDRRGNIWTGNFGGNEIVVFIGGDPENVVSAPLEFKPFGLALASDDTVWAATIGSEGLFPVIPNPDSNVTRWRLNEEQTALEMIFSTQIGVQLKGLDIDFEDHAWVASGGDDTVYRLDPDGNVVGAYSGGGISSPWSTRIDDAGDVWVANFGPMTFNPAETVYRNSAVTKLAGPNSSSGQPVGTPLTPPTGYTLPSAGAPVLLSDGTPLSQTGDQPAFTPMMRTVTVVPDRAGNLWVSNNWKPNFNSNVFGGNPGGDGMVIFIGIAAPTEPGRTQ